MAINGQCTQIRFNFATLSKIKVLGNFLPVLCCNFELSLAIFNLLFAMFRYIAVNIKQICCHQITLTMDRASSKFTLH